MTTHKKKNVGANRFKVNARHVRKLPLSDRIEIGIATAQESGREKSFRTLVTRRIHELVEKREYRDAKEFADRYGFREEIEKAVRKIVFGENRGTPSDRIVLAEMYNERFDLPEVVCDAKKEVVKEMLQSAIEDIMWKDKDWTVSGLKGEIEWLVRLYDLDLKQLIGEFLEEFKIKYKDDLAEAPGKHGFGEPHRKAVRWMEREIEKLEE